MTLSSSDLVDYAKSLDCIHCGLCLQSCPTFRLTGAEPSSPRGRIHLMRAVAEDRLEPDASFAEEMEFCLLCRHCESVCPAGVRFGSMMEHTRGHLPHTGLDGWLRRIGFRHVLPKRGVLRLLGSLLRLAQVTGIARLVARIGGERAAGLADLPPVPPLGARRLLPAVTPAETERRGCVQVLEGCVMPELYARVNRATVRSLARLGVEGRVPPGVTCCGSLHAHNGDLEGARSLVRTMVEAFEAGAEEADLGIVVNSAGCAAHMKECHELFAEDDPWHARARSFAARVRDYSEVVAPILAEDGAGRLRLAPGLLGGTVAWDDPCHLCHGQGIRDQPREILACIEGLETTPLADSESCCGSAGIYSLLRPDTSRAVFEPKRGALERSGAAVLATANPGCQLQWESGLRRAGSSVRVVHLAELVEAALAPDSRSRPGSGPESA